MNQIHPGNVELFNRNLRFEDPGTIVEFALELASRPVITTSFGPHSASILHLVTSQMPDIPVIWCDTGYNTPATYHHVERLTQLLKLNLDIFTPKFTTAYLESKLGAPEISNPNHGQISEMVKLEPFKRAIDLHKPDVWFTNIRKGQTVHRNELDVLSYSREGILKVSPFYHYGERDLEAYMKGYGLPGEHDYFDPVKALENRECGIHLKH